MCFASFHKLERIYSPFLYGGKKEKKQGGGGGGFFVEFKEN